MDLGPIWIYFTGINIFQKYLHKYFGRRTALKQIKYWWSLTHHEHMAASVEHWGSDSNWALGKYETRIQKNKQLLNLTH